MAHDLIPRRLSAGLPAPLAIDPVAAFLAGRNPWTIDAYRHDLADFTAFQGRPTPTDAIRELLSRPHGEANALALAYRGHRAERRLSSATIARRLAGAALGGQRKAEGSAVPFGDPFPCHSRWTSPNCLADQAIASA